jgi:hypothetical protein
MQKPIHELKNTNNPHKLIHAKQPAKGEKLEDC